MKQRLVQALEMSLMPNDLSIQEGRNILEAGKTHAGFLKEMVLILADPGVPLEIRTAAACTVKELILQHYERKEGNFCISDEDKQAFRDSVFHIFAEINPIRVLRKTIEEAYQKVVLLDFPHQWPNLAACIAETIKNSPDKGALQSPLLVLAIVLERYQAEMDVKREPLIFLENNVFPFLENVATCQVDWDNFNSVNQSVCYLLLRCFQAAIFLRYDDYFTVDRFKFWMFFVKRVLDQKIDPEQLRKPPSWQKVLEAESSLDWKLKRISGNIICRTLHSVKMVKKRTQPNLAALKEQFFSQYASGFLTSCFNFLKLGLDLFISPKFAQYCLKYLFYAFQVEQVVQGLASELDYVLFDLCTPLLGMNQKDEENWNAEPASFLYAQDCRIDAHNYVKNASRDLIDQILRLVDNNQIPMISKVVGYTQACLESQTNVRNGQPLTPRFKECLIALMIHCHKKIVLETDTIQQDAERLVERYLSKELFNEHDIIKARACNLISIYGAVHVVEPQSLETLCMGLEAAMNSGHLAVQTSALLALNRCTANDKVCAYFSTKLTQVFELIVKCMQSVDFKELVYAAEGLIKDFGDQILPYSVDLLRHFNTCFYQYLQHAKVDLNETDDEEVDFDDESEMEGNIIYESIYAAEACLEAILSILQVNLPPEVRSEANNMVLCMICDVIHESNNELFVKALALLNFVLYKETTLNDAMKFFFPVICYVLNGKPNTLLVQAAGGLPENFLKVLTEIDLPSLSEGVVNNSLGCFLNFIAKLGADFYTSTDYFGIPFVDLLFETMVKVIKEALTSNSDTDIVFMLRIVLGLLEHSKDRFEVRRFKDFLDMVLSLCEVNRTDTLNQNILQTVAMFIWHSPVVTIEHLSQANKLEQFFETLFQKLEMFNEEKAKERAIYGLVALLELPPEQAKSMNLGLIMGGIVRAAQELTEIRVDAENPKKEKPSEEVDLKANKEYEDDDSDEDFDDADEELEAIENDDKFRYDSPLQEHCPLLYLKFLLIKLETNQPEFFKEVMGSLHQSQIDNLLLAIKMSEEYIQKVRAELASIAAPHQ